MRFSQIPWLVRATEPCVDEEALLDAAVGAALDRAALDRNARRA